MQFFTIFLPLKKNTALFPIKTEKSTLLVYTLNRELKLFDVMKAQLCATQGKKGLTQEPAIQLLEVGPGLQICVHHNRDPEKCFVGTLTQHASSDNYESLTEYVQCWEPLVVSESALTSVKDSEFLLLRDVELQWPDFQLCTTSSGDTYYKMKQSRNADEEWDFDDSLNRIRAIIFLLLQNVGRRLDMHETQQQ